MSANNTLVQLDSDETNETIFSPLNLNGHIDTEPNRLQSPPTVDVLTANVYDSYTVAASAAAAATAAAVRPHISAPLLSTVDDDQRQLLGGLPLTTDSATAYAAIATNTQTHLLQPNYQHHRRAFSDDRQRNTSASQPLHTLQTHSNQYLNEFDSTATAATATPSAGYNLINLAAPTLRALSLSDEEDADDHNIHLIDHATDTHNLHTADDTVEISLLGDTSMDSRESQPLLSCGRDAQDYVYNNFPGESAE